MPSCSSDSVELSRCRRPSTWVWEGRRSGGPAADVLADELVYCCNSCNICWSWGVGAESNVLEGGRGVFGVDGSSVMNGDVEGWRSSARTTSAGVPLVAECYKDVSGDFISRYCCRNCVAVSWS